MRIALLLLIFLWLPLSDSTPPWPDHKFVANIKTSSTTSENGTAKSKTTISFIQGAYKFSRRRVNKKETKGFFYCHNANKGCLTKCIANIDGDMNHPDSYNIEDLETDHTCMDTVE